MAHTIRTLLLNDAWDVTLDNTGRIAVSSGPYSTAQDVANEVRRFINDSYFDYNQGIPHFDTELGHLLPEAALRSYMRKAAQRVPMCPKF